MRQKTAVLTDRLSGPVYPHKELIRRVLVNRCELCQNAERCSCSRPSRSPEAVGLRAVPSQCCPERVKVGSTSGGPDAAG